ncbi:putative elongator complex protein 1 isoform X2 [Lineus longissimus]
MRNLKLLRSLCVDSFRGLRGKSKCISVDYDTGNIFCANESCLGGFDPNTGETVASVSLVEEGYITYDDGKFSTEIVAIQHLPDQFSLCVALRSGDVLLWNVASQEVECVGSVESGLLAMSWSPDQEVVVLVTGQNTIIMMNREFDPITEVNLHPEEFGEAQFVTVGWGKKETQFHGTEGKEAAKKKKEAVSLALPWDDGLPRISWRGDGQYFVISTINPEDGARQLRVWTRECVLHSTSEKTDSLEQAMDWKPSGSLIATSQRKPNKHVIAFFERNGLQHGEFTLPFHKDEVRVRELYWNKESTVLLVWCEDLLKDDDTKTPKSYVQLWTCGNYHWYLKQNLVFSEADMQVSCIQWDPDHTYDLHVVCTKGRYLQYNWTLTTDSSHGRTAADLATVAVVDGDKLLLTPFRKAVVPPPMCAVEWQLPTAVDEVAFASVGNTNRLAAILNDGRMAFYEMTGSKSVQQEYSCEDKDIFCIQSTSRYPLMYNHFTWVGEDTFIFVGQKSPFDFTSVIYRGQIDKSSQSQAVMKRAVADVEGFVYGICLCPETGNILVQLKDGILLKYEYDEEEEEAQVLPWQTSSGLEIGLPQTCNHIAVCTIGDEEVVLGLTERYRFYVNGMEVASNCTSFAVHDEFLLLATHAHTCRCIHRTTKVRDLPTLSDGKEHPYDESIRRVERGSRIVCIVPEDTKLVLQMPRGNLETIHPRALVLATVRKYLDRLQFKEAFTLMKKHRINMNLIYDHNPQVFLENTSLFIEQVDAVNNINLFLTGLQEDDVTNTMYTWAYKEDELVRKKNAGGKVDKICDTVRETLVTIDKDKFLLSILTAHVKKTEPEMDRALQRIKDLRDSGGRNVKGVTADEAIRYLLYLVDVNELYDVALGTYDFELVLMVAEKSQKDPKEYLPFLNELRALEPDYQHYVIDKHLKRYSKALRDIAKCGKAQFSECLELVQEHKLYSEALGLYPLESQEYKDIAVVYGEHLSGSHHYDEAGLVFWKAEEWECALEAFKKNKSWRQCFCMAMRMNYGPEKMSELARNLADTLKGSHRHIEAACILEDYAKDPEESIVTLIEGCCWEEALRLIHKHNRLDFIESDLKAALVESCESYEQLLSGLETDFDKYRARLAVVRAQKERERLEILEGGGNFNDADADLFSDISSATGQSVSSFRSSSQGSTYSRSSGRSSKNRRKAAAKKWSLKEGSNYEDLALIDALAKCINKVEQTKDEVGSLLKTLVLFDYNNEAKALQTNLMTIAKTMAQALPEIWVPEDEEEMEIGPHSTANSLATAAQQGKQVIRSQLEKDPVLKIAPVIKKDKGWTMQSLSGNG